MQIEHALAAVSQGATSLGIKAHDAIVIATEKRAPSPLVDDSALERISTICPNIGIVYSGMGPDYRVLVSSARKAAQTYWKTSANILLPSASAGNRNAYATATQRGGVRPFGVSLLVAGYDSARGASLYQVDPSGSYFMWKASAIGKNMQNAKTFLEKRYNDDISQEDAIHTALLTLKEGFEGQMTEKTIEIGVISKSFTKKLGNGDHGEAIPVFRKLSEQEVKDYLAL